jgi:hypothetical protein
VSYPLGSMQQRLIAPVEGVFAGEIAGDALHDFPLFPFISMPKATEEQASADKDGKPSDEHASQPKWILGQTVVIAHRDDAADNPTKAEDERGASKPYQKANVATNLAVILVGSAFFSLYVLYQTVRINF